MAKRKFPLRKLKRRLNQTTFLLVIGLGLVAMMTILSDPGRLKSRGIVTEREPASIEASPTDAPELIRAASVLSLDCDDKEEAISLTQQVRLRGRLCKAENGAHIVSSQIENKRNGYVATVFHQDREFTTDFIQLVMGDNQLVVKHTLSDGQVEVHDLMIKRQ